MRLNIKKLHVLLILLGTTVGSSCQNHITAFDVLVQTGFAGKELPFCQVSDGKVIKNTNQDVPALYEAIKHSVVIKCVSEPPSYTVNLENGSTFASEIISISIGKQGEGRIDYMGTQRICFRSPEFRKVCESAFNQSNIIVK
jgi:hypothetical protein